MLNVKLEPCPFCGGKAYIAYEMGYTFIDAFHTKKCLIKPNTWLESNKKINKQIKGWNRRK